MAGPRPHGIFSLYVTATDCLDSEQALYPPQCLSFPWLPLAETWLMWHLSFPATLQSTPWVSPAARQKPQNISLCQHQHCLKSLFHQRTLFGLPTELSQSPSHPLYNTHPMAGEPGNPEGYFHPCRKLRCWEFVYPPLTPKCLPS